MSFTQSLALMLPGFLLTIILHEYAHALMAYLRGDHTAKERMTLNPMVHLELWGSVLIPLLNLKLGGFLFGWGKPLVPKTYLLKNRFDLFLIYLAGPLMNFFLGVLFSFLGVLALKFQASSLVLEFLQYTTFMNFLSLFFNLLPLPPLDGFFLLSTFLEKKYERFVYNLILYAPHIFLAFFFLSFLGLPILGYLITKPAHYCLQFFNAFFYKVILWNS